jgi:hypothetical protein
MQKKAEERSKRKAVILKTIIIFLISYLLFLIVWIQVKNYYGYVSTYIASKLVMLIQDVRLEGMERAGDTIQATFSPLRHDNLLIDIPVKISSYTFNAPLTFAIMAAFYLFIRRRGRAYAEALLLLLIVHLLYIFSLEAKLLTEILRDRGIEAVSQLRIAVCQFLWSFTDNMVIRFEPFLIGFYMFLRFRKL